MYNQETAAGRKAYFFQTLYMNMELTDTVRPIYLQIRPFRYKGDAVYLSGRVHQELEKKFDIVYTNIWPVSLPNLEADFKEEAFEKAVSNTRLIISVASHQNRLRQYQNVLLERMRLEKHGENTPENLEALYQSLDLYRLDQTLYQKEDETKGIFKNIDVTDRLYACSYRFRDYHPDQFTFSLSANHPRIVFDESDPVQLEAYKRENRERNFRRFLQMEKKQVCELSHSRAEEEDFRQMVLYRVFNAESDFLIERKGGPNSPYSYHGSSGHYFDYLSLREIKHLFPENMQQVEEALRWEFKA